MLAVFVRAVLAFERRRARRRGVRGGVGGAVTAIQRFGSALNTNVHFHTLAVQGVFVEQADGALRFAPAPAPSDLDVARLLASVRRRIVRLVKRHGMDLEQPSGEVDDGRRIRGFVANFRVGQGFAARRILWRYVESGVNTGYPLAALER